MNTFRSIAQTIRNQTLRSQATLFLLLVFIINLILLLFFEKTEFDTFTYYFSKVELRRFGTELKPIFTSFVQEFMPVGYSRIQMLFASAPLARNAVNFVVCVSTMLFFIFRLKDIGLLACIFCLLNVGFFMQSTGYKADCAIACFALLAVFISTRDYFLGLITLLAMSFCLMLSVKWTSGMIILPIVVLTTVRFIRGPLPKNGIYNVSLDLFCTALVTLTLSNVLDLSTYARSYMKLGSFVPTQALGVAQLHKPDAGLLIRGFVQYSLTSIVETFEPMWVFLAEQGVHLSWIRHFTLGSKASIIVSPNQTYSYLSIIDLLGLLSSVACIRSRGRFIQISAITSIFYFATSFSAYDYQNQMCRYFIPAQVLSYFPLAYVCIKKAYPKISGYLETHRLRLTYLVLAILAVFKIGREICLDHERNLAKTFSNPILDVYLTGGRSSFDSTEIEPIYKRELWGQDSGLGSDYREVYDRISKDVQKGTAMIVLYDSSENSAGYTFPFLSIREPSNTWLVDLSSKRVQIPEAEYILCFGKSSCQMAKKSGFNQTTSQEVSNIGLYRRGNGAGV